MPPRLVRVTRAARRAFKCTTEIRSITSFSISPFAPSSPIRCSFYAVSRLWSSALDLSLPPLVRLSPLGCLVEDVRNNSFIAADILSHSLELSKLASSGMSTSTTLARLLLRPRDHLLKCSSLMCLRKTDISLKNKEHSGSGHAKASPSGSVHKTPFTSKSFYFILLREFALFPISGIRFRTSGKRRTSSFS